MTMMLAQIIDRIKTSNNIALLPHISADGDSIGSSTSLGLALEKIGKKAVIYLEEQVPVTFSFIPGQHLIKVYDGTCDNHDLVIALDSGDLKRLGNRVEIFNKCSCTVNIDHHQTNDMFAQLNYVDSGSAAVSEIIYHMVKLAGISLDKDIATCLYVAIVTDTGGFRYSNTTKVTHQIAGDLIDNGADAAFISQQVFENTSLEKIRLTGKVIDALEILENGKVSLVSITDQIIRESGAKDEDCEGMVNIGRSIQGVEVAAVLKFKEEGLIKVNLRSKDYVDVSQIAMKFSGGGHKRAAGCTVKGSLEDVRELLMAEIRRALVI